MADIDKFMKNHGIAYAIVTNLDSGLIETLGNISDLAYDDLVKQLFADFNSIKSLNKSLEGQMMPQIWSQGEVRCIVIKPTVNIIIGLLYNEHRPPFESIDFVDEVNNELLKCW